MNNNIFDSPMFLIKFGKREFLEQIIIGILRFTNLRRYLDFENHTIGDENEGMESIFHQDGKMKVSFIHPQINNGTELDCSNSVKSIKNFPEVNLNTYLVFLFLHKMTGVMYYCL